MKYGIIILLVMGLVSTSCNEWLHVNPNSEKEADAFLQTELGYRGALIGLYMQMKKDNGYGNNLTTGFVEHLAQHWTPKMNTVGEYSTNFDYADASVEGIIDNTYLHLYNIIAGANKILETIDDNREVFSSEKLYHLIKAEALGIRAWCHFDILRLWGPIPGQVTGGKLLPYVTVISKKPNDFDTYEQYVGKLLKDLTEAESLLKEIDPLIENSLAQCWLATGDSFADNFWGYRQTRINYYAVCGLKARLFLWNGDKPEALEYARKVIDAKYSGNNNTYNLGDRTSFESGSDGTLYSEHIFALEVQDLDSKVYARFRNSGNHNFLKDKSQVAVLYEVNDARFVLWSDVTIDDSGGNGTSGGSTTVYTIKKFFQQKSMNTISANKVPLMRLSEMLFIAIECGDPDAAALYEQFCNIRGVTTGDITDLTSEYNREFYAEGQMFFTYKRLGKKEMMWGTGVIENMKDVYVLPLPKSEVIVR